MRSMLEKTLRLRREQRKYIMGTGVSGSRQNALETAMDEIDSINKDKAVPPKDGEYLVNSTRKLTPMEKKKKGELLRRKVSFDFI